MKCILILVMMVIVILGLCACSNKVDDVPISHTVSDDLFTVTIYADSGEYNHGTPVICYTVLKYTGDAPITVYHADPILCFSIADDKYFFDECIRQAILRSTTFEPNQEVHMDFQKSGAWVPDGPNAKFYEEFYSENELILPKGQYKLIAHLQYSLDDEQVLETMHEMQAEIDVVIVR